MENKIYVDKEYERIVEVPYDVIRENVIFQENVIDIDERDLGNYRNAKILDTEVEYIHRDQIIDKPVYIDRIVEEEYQVPVDKIIEVPVERIVERPVEQIIQRPVPVEKINERVVEVPIEVPVYKNIEVFVERPVYIENIIEKPVPYEKVIEKEVEIPIEHIVERPVFIDNIIKK